MFSPSSDGFYLLLVITTRRHMTKRPAAIRRQSAGCFHLVSGSDRRISRLSEVEVCQTMHQRIYRTSSTDLTSSRINLVGSSKPSPAQAPPSTGCSSPQVTIMYSANKKSSSTKRAWHSGSSLCHETARFPFSNWRVCGLISNDPVAASGTFHVCAVLVLLQEQPHTLHTASSASPHLFQPCHIHANII